MTKRSSVRLLSFGLLLAGILIIYAITGTVQAAQYRARLESTYRQSLSALAEDLEGIETDLTKSVYANGAATLSDVSRDLSQQANQAKDSLSRLPVEQMNLAGTYKFLSQTGDYSTYLSKKVYAGEVVTAKEHENLLRLLQYATKYKNSVTLEPMNPYERRIIHSEIQKIPGITTTSVGIDDERLVQTFPPRRKPLRTTPPCYMTAPLQTRYCTKSRSCSKGRTKSVRTLPPRSLPRHWGAMRPA